MGTMGIGSKVKSGDYADCSIKQDSRGVYIKTDFPYARGEKKYLNSHTLTEKPVLVDKKKKLVGAKWKTYFYCKLYFKTCEECYVRMSEKKYHTVMNEF